MKMVRAFILLISSTLVILGASAAQAETKLEKSLTAGNVQLTGEEYRALFVGATHTFSRRPVSGFIYVAPNGKTGIVGKSPRGTFEDFGVLTIQGDTVCWKWELFSNGEKICSTAVREGDKIQHYYPDGSVGNLVTEFRPGNAEGLHGF